MTGEERRQWLYQLDEDMLKGGIILSEWCTFIIRDADEAFVAGALLATILTAVAAIETFLRFDHQASGKERLVTLANQTNPTLAEDIHTIRQYRNKWVHVFDPQEDQDLQDNPEKYKKELEQMAFTAMKVLRQTIYENQFT